jgi:hypothetical protein
MLIGHSTERGWWQARRNLADVLGVRVGLCCLRLNGLLLLPAFSAGFSSDSHPRLRARSTRVCHASHDPLWLQEAAPGSTFIATMSSQEEVDEWRSKPKTLGGVNEHVYWGYPNDPAEVTPVCALHRKHAYPTKSVDM